MKEERVNIEDIEVEDVVFVNKKWGYCSVKQIEHGLNNGLILVLECTGIGCVGFGMASKQTAIYYKRTKTFKMFE